jgi:hypothetical protein
MSSIAIKHAVMIGCAQPVTAPPQWRCSIDRILFEWRERTMSRIGRYDLKSGPAAMKDKEAGAAPGAFDDAAKSGA